MRKSEGRWAHKKYAGRIHWDETLGGVLVAEVQTKAESEEWQLLRAFIGYLDRHLGDGIESIAILYR